MPVYIIDENLPAHVPVTGNIKKKIFYKLIEQIWHEAEAMLQLSSFIIINEDKLEGF